MLYRLWVYQGLEKLHWNTFETRGPLVLSYIRFHFKLSPLKIYNNCDELLSEIKTFILEEATDDDLEYISLFVMQKSTMTTASDIVDLVYLMYVSMKDKISRDEYFHQAIGHLIVMGYRPDWIEKNFVDDFSME